MPCPWAYVRPEDDEDACMVCEKCSGTGQANPAFIGAGLCDECRGSGIAGPIQPGKLFNPRPVDPSYMQPAVGDINTEAKGTGARYNAGKVPWELMPIEVVADLLVAERAEQASVLGAIRELGQLQAGKADIDFLAQRILEEAAEAADMTMQELLEEAAFVLEYGSKKYKAFNWAKGMPWSVPIGCAMRHLLKMWEFPRAQDHESSRLHAGHVAANVIFLLTYMVTYPEGDDRPTTLREQA